MLSQGWKGHSRRVYQTFLGMNPCPSLSECMHEYKKPQLGCKWSWPGFMLGRSVMQRAVLRKRPVLAGRGDDDQRYAGSVLRCEQQAVLYPTVNPGQLSAYVPSTRCPVLMFHMLLLPARECPALVHVLQYQRGVALVNSAAFLRLPLYQHHCDIANCANSGIWYHGLLSAMTRGSRSPTVRFVNGQGHQVCSRPCFVTDNTAF